MKVAIISDIHGNRHAFEAALADIAEAAVEEVWCLGDLVGYGAEPDACVELARENTDRLPRRQPRPRVAGRSRSTSSRAARDRRALDARGDRRPTTATTSPSCEPSAGAAGIGLYHASPRDQVWEYVLSTLLAELCLDAARHRVNLIGHSHVALSFDRPEGAPGDRRDAPRRSRLDCPRASGCSTPAASGSRATAIRARRGCCSTPTS